MKRHCNHCNTPISGDYTIGYATLCPVCSQELHTCLNCRFYSPGSYHDCLESVEEVVLDKDRANHCDSFMLGGSTTAKKERAEHAKARAEALFS
jgi:hypothetical protein